MPHALFGKNANEQVAAIREGLPFDLFAELASTLGASAPELSRVMLVSPRTLQRRKAKGSFSPSESDRLYRLVRLTQHAREALGDASTEWLTTPKKFLAGETPLTFADTEAGAVAVEQALGRLEHGVFL